MRVDDEADLRWWTLLVKALLWHLMRDSEFVAENKRLSLRPAHVMQKLLAVFRTGFDGDHQAWMMRTDGPTEEVPRRAA